MQRLPIFLTRDLVTSNNTLSISHSPRPLAAGPIQNAKIMESLLGISYLNNVRGGEPYGCELTVIGQDRNYEISTVLHWL